MHICTLQLKDIITFKTEVSCHWGLSDPGEIHWYLGFKVKHNRQMQTISINQQVYIESIVERFRLTSARPISTPMEPGVVLMEEQCPELSKSSVGMDKIPYGEAIGSTMGGNDLLTQYSLCGGGACPIYSKNQTVYIGKH